jgi:hypothetical protein
MHTAALETNDTRQGILATELTNQPLDDSGLHENSTKILDSLVPLQKASHADVAEYRVEIPLRYAECVAVLKDGRKVKFTDPRKFLGWSCHEPRRSLLFRNNDITLEVEVDNRAADRERCVVRSINLQAAIRQGAQRLKKFIGIDGDLIILPAT